MRTDDALVVCSSTANSMEELSVTCYPETCLTSHFCLWKQSFLLGRATASSHLSLSSTAVPAALGTETSIWDMIFRLICAQDRSKGQYLRLTGRMLCLRCLPRWEPILGKMSQRNDCPRRTFGLRATGITGWSWYSSQPLWPRTWCWTLACLLYRKSEQN